MSKQKNGLKLKCWTKKKYIQDLWNAQSVLFLNLKKYMFLKVFLVFNRPVVARAVLQSPPWFINSLTLWSFNQNIFQVLSIPNQKSLGAALFKGCSSYTMCHMSHVKCHVSPVTCHVSPVTCHLSHVKIFFFLQVFLISVFFYL